LTVFFDFLVDEPLFFFDIASNIFVKYINFFLTCNSFYKINLTEKRQTTKRRKYFK
jgi:hypothetical protein